MNAARQLRSYIVTAVLAVGVIYLALRGSEWPAIVWALFCVFAVAITTVSILRDVGRLSDDQYFGFQNNLGLLMAVALLVGAVSQQSLLLFGLGMLVGYLWFDDRRFLKEKRRRG
jgi:hypothetical protein